MTYSDVIIGQVLHHQSKLHQEAPDCIDYTVLVCILLLTIIFHHHYQIILRFLDKQ